MLALDGGVCRDVRLGFRNVGATTFRLPAVEARLDGQPPGAAMFAEAAEAAMTAVDPPSDVHADEVYRRDLVKVLTERVLATAAGRARREQRKKTAGGQQCIDKETVTVNGARYERRVEPRLLLCDFLRDELRLTGTHVGCEHGVCGTCTVLLDGRAARSCLWLAVQADGASIDTVESLGRPRRCTRSSRRSGRSTACSAASARPAC